MTFHAITPLQDKGIDHVVLRVADLDSAEALYRSLGFHLTPRGFHTGRGSSNHTTPFSGGTYIELIHIPEGVSPPSFADKPRGPVAIALKPVSSQKLYEDLTAAGYELAPPRDLSRPVDLPSGASEARFLNLGLPQGGVDEARLFACQHLTPDLVWRPEWITHANGATNVAAVIAVHDAPETVIDFYQRLFGAAAVRRTPDGVTVDLGPQSLTILTPEAFSARFPSEPLSAHRENGWFAGLSLQVKDLAATSELLSRAGIPSHRTSETSLFVSADVASGSLIEFITP
jgi:catechol 2,3-dioxygenase-like lactoylglutathione lyase family enzyme